MAHTNSALCSGGIHHIRCRQGFKSFFLASGARSRGRWLRQSPTPPGGRPASAASNGPVRRVPRRNTTPPTAPPWHRPESAAARDGIGVCGPRPRRVPLRHNAGGGFQSSARRRPTRGRSAGPPNPALRHLRPPSTTLGRATAYVPPPCPCPPSRSVAPVPLRLNE